MHTPPSRTDCGQYGLFAGNLAESAQVRQVRGADERHQGNVGLDHRRKHAHLARRADPRLDNGVPVAGRVEPRQGERDADLVVEVALGCEHARGLSPKQERQELLRRCLARASRDPDDLPGKSPSLLAGHRLERRQRVGNDELRKGDPRIGPGDEGGIRPRVQGRAEELMAVAPARLERDEGLAGRERARVGGKPRGRGRQGPHPPASGPSRESVWLEGWHQVRSAFTPISSRTTWRSSKGITVSANSW